MKQLELREYQKLIRDFIIPTPRCNIWADCGLGKTAATISALQHFLPKVPVLVVAPPRVAREVWPDEVKEWAQFKGIKTVSINNLPLSHREYLLNSPPPPGTIYTISYNIVQWLAYHMNRKKWAWPVIIADESSKLRSYRRGGGTLTARCMAMLAARAERFVGLTASPGTKGLKDLWGQMWYIDGGKRLGASFKDFADRWFHSEPVYRQGKLIQSAERLTPKPGAEEEILSLISDVVLRVATEDWFDLEKPIHVNVPIHLPEKIQKAYAKMEATMVTEVRASGLDLEMEIIAPNASARSHKCYQLAQGTVPEEGGQGYHVIHDLKLEALQEIIDENEGKNIIVVYRYVTDSKHILNKIKGSRRLGGAGSTPQSDSQTIAAWNRGEVPVLVMNALSGGHGLNLQHGGSIMVFYSHDFNTEAYQQVMERIGPARQAASGYKRNVFMYHLITQNTLDELPLAVVSGDLEQQTRILAGVKSKHGLSQPAVAEKV